MADALEKIAAEERRTDLVRRFESCPVGAMKHHLAG
jgi:hypothetical protein